MIVTGQGLHDLIDAGVITALHENVGPSSIDVRVTDFRVELPGIHRSVKLSRKDDMELQPAEIAVLRPGMFCLASTIEAFNMPDDLTAQFFLRSSAARLGLNHMLAGFIDPGFNGANLTLELHNVSQSHRITLEPGDRIGQIVFHRHEPVSADQSYRTRGRYNGQMGTVASKGIKP